MKTANEINWHLVEDLTLKSFTGTRLSPEEMDILKHAYEQNPEEYTSRTGAIRDVERRRLSMM